MRKNETVILESNSENILPSYDSEENDEIEYKSIFKLNQITY